MKDELDEEEFPSAWGVYRRAKIEGALRDAAAKHGFLARAERNESGAYHTVIESARFCLTESRVPEAGKMPRKARFRDVQALNNTPLFATIEPLELPEDKKFAVILIHGPSRLDRTRLGFIMIRFPNADCSRWLDASINLLYEFPDVAVVSPKTDAFCEEVIPPPPGPEIRTDLEKKGRS